MKCPSCGLDMPAGPSCDELLRALVEDGWGLTIIPEPGAIELVLRRDVKATGPTLHEALAAATAKARS